MNNPLFDLMFIIVPIFIGCVFIFIFMMMLSPKLKGKFMGRQLKATKYMIDENEKVLKDIATKNANISKEGREITARAIKEGLTDDTIYCKHCGKSIEEDSKYCRYCGNEQN